MCGKVQSNCEMQSATIQSGIIRTCNTSDELSEKPISLARETQKYPSNWRGAAYKQHLEQFWWLSKVDVEWWREKKTDVRSQAQNNPNGTGPEMVAIKEIELVTIIDMVTFQIHPPVRQYNQVQRAIAIANNAHTRKLSLSLFRTRTQFPCILKLFIKL